MKQWVLVNLHCDRSGIVGIYGPYDDESIAACAELDIKMMGIYGIFETHRLMPFKPFDDDDDD